MGSVTCGCTVPCERLFYHPSLSYAHLSKYNIKELAVSSKSRKELIQASFHSSVEVSHAVVKTLISEENEMFQLLDQHINEMLLSFQNYTLHFDTSADMADLLLSADIITGIGDALNAFGDTVDASFCRHLDFLEQTETVKQVKNQLIQTILDSLKNPKLINISGSLFDGCVERIIYNTTSHTTLASAPSARKKRDIDQVTTPMYSKVKTAIKGKNHLDDVYRQKRRATVAFQTICSTVVNNIFPYYFLYNAYLESDKNDNGEIITTSLMDEYQRNYTKIMVELFNNTHADPDDFPEHDICLSSLEYLQNVTDPAITTIVKAVSDLFSPSYNDRNGTVDLLQNIESAIEQGSLTNDEDIYKKSDSCLWPINYVAQMSKTTQANTYENQIRNTFQTLMSSSAQKASTLTIDFDVLKRCLQSFMISFKDNFLPTMKDILQYREMGLSKDVAAKYATNSEAFKIRDTFFSTLSDFEDKLKYLHLNLDTICSLCKDSFDISFRLALPAFNDYDLFGSQLWQTFVSNSSDVYMQSLGARYVTDRRRYMHEIINQIFQPYLTYIADVMTNTSNQRENIFNSLKDVESNMDDYLLSQKMDLEFYM